ncbi:MAG: LysM peptidoglycan-binding domain-containing protein [Leptospiraceae bacterium]|nr:LysM peptidoglycan-binding domain-containing protein [Leptospiraceae bacterium]
MKFVSYVVKPDDTLQRISAYYYADWTLWKWIYGVNHLSSYILRASQVIKIPYPITEERIHKVQKGDSYESLALTVTCTAPGTPSSPPLNVAQFNQIKNTLGDILANKVKLS